MDISLVNAQGVAQQLRARLHTQLDAAGRRLMDIIVAVLGLLALTPLFLFLAWRIKRDSPGPVFYSGPRVGRGGQIFLIKKFRTMFNGPASDQGPRLTAHDDPRISTLGRWLRTTKLNELPQLWNVLVGDMSLVGPRPEDPALVTAWPPEMAPVLLAVRPGVTSPASVIFHDEEDRLHTLTAMDDYLAEILPSKLRLDVLYLHERSLLSDLDVMLWTLVTLLPGLKNATVREYQLLWGPLNILVNRYFSWLLVDSLVALAAVISAAVLWGAAALPLSQLREVAAWSLGMALVFTLGNAVLGLQHVAWARARAVDALLLALSVGASTVIMAGVNRLIGQTLPLGMLVFAGLAALVGFAVVRYRTRLLTGPAQEWLNRRGVLSRHGERVLIVGAGESANCAACLLKRPDLAQLVSVIGMVDDNPRLQRLRFNGCEVLGQIADLPRLAAQHNVGVIVFAIALPSPADRARILAACRTTNARVIRFPDLRRDVQAQLSQLAPRLTPSQVRAWLEELQQLAANGEWAACRSRMGELQASLEENGHARLVA